MRYLIDTSVWSFAFRRQDSQDHYITELLIKIIEEGNAALCGPVRQELLSGIKDIEQFKLLKSKLLCFEDIPLSTSDYELAAEYYNICRAKGIQGSGTDFLLCAIAVNNDLGLVTTDNDFLLYRKHISFNLKYISIRVV